MRDTLLPPDDSWHPVEDAGFIDHVGPIYYRDNGDAPQWIGFRAGDHHRNLNGVVQGGMLMTLSDRGLGRIARQQHGGPVATINFNYDFIGAGRIGTFIEIHPNVVKETGSLVFMEGEVLSDGDLIGRAHGLWKKLKRKPV
ncbi:PaaI family thioesterase [Pseudooceanicola onchidii]|uniref:PaaI family thioesterase n=1 Tax=Pseudooceanicola onchidii TaxID=2562279 RepID=UPI0010AA2ACA|nr:PaaI family thioesterase [Pseudooceanicola onchidii]